MEQAAYQLSPGFMRTGFLLIVALSFFVFRAYLAVQFLGTCFVEGHDYGYGQGKMV